MNTSVYKASWLRTGIVKKEELDAFDGSAADSVTEMQLIEDQLEKMQLEDEMEEIGDAEKAQEEVEKDKKNKQDDKKTLTQPIITCFFKKINFNSVKECHKSEFWYFFVGKS